MAATIYFGVVATDLTTEIYPDTDAAAGSIESLAQRSEYDVMRRLRITTAPADTITKENIKFAVILYTACELESREPHSQADGSVREDKFSRVLWKQQADEIIADLRTSANPVFYTQPTS